ncbi:hypothetical protein [Rubrivirga sp. IMCC43871]|uniref:hypothetical protein n=1 Tax=Rubrivirga sp. IMCC43871 TaxID=3391575 RepID=UPI00398FFFC0
MIRALTLLAALAAGAHAQPAETDAATHAASRALLAVESADADAVLAAVLAAGALGGLDVVAVAGRAVAVRTASGLVAFNPTDEPVFLRLPGDRMPPPLVPVEASRDAGRIASLVALVGDDDTLFGLRVPPRVTVVYRPAAPSDVRPRGLDE